MGMVVCGSLQAGIQMKLTWVRCVENITAGTLLVVEDERHEFFAMITEVTPDCVPLGALADPPAYVSTAAAFLGKALAGTSTLGIVTMKPMLMRDKAAGGEFAPVNIVPTHFSEVGEATEEDMDEIPVCLDLEKFAERSKGIFGQSGTGKTFLTRICLCGMIMHKKAVNLIFDMHGEYV